MGGREVGVEGLSTFEELNARRIKNQTKHKQY